MTFIVYQCKDSPDWFVVTDADHEAALGGKDPEDQGDLVRIGGYGEIGEERTSFNEALAHQSIGKRGYYRFHAKTFDPVATPPVSMP